MNELLLLWSEIIKYYNQHLKTLLIGLLCISMVLITALLVVEYRFFKKQAAAMIVVKEDYNNHVLALNRILLEYNKNKERLEQLESVIEHEKKKINNTNSVSNFFPEGAQVYSSDDDIDDKDSFVPVNRELEYLKQASLNYLKEQRLHAALQRIKKDAWNEYTDTLLERHAQQRTASAPRSKRRRKRRINARKKTEKLSPHVRDMIRREVAHHDIQFTWPIKRSEFWLSSFFGPRKINGRRGFHTGIDMAAVRGTPVCAVASGVVIEARHAKGYGKTVLIAHNNKYSTRYAHLDKIFVSSGDKIERGETLGHVGSTGYVRSKKGRDASHLHFEVSAFGERVDPMYFFA